MSDPFSVITIYFIIFQQLSEKSAGLNVKYAVPGMGVVKDVNFMKPSQSVCLQCLHSISLLSPL